MWKKLAIVAVIALAHGFLTILVGIQEWGASGFLGFFPTPAHVYWKALLTALEFPVLGLFGRLGVYDRLYDVGLVLNSGLWAMLLYHIGRCVKGATTAHAKTKRPTTTRGRALS